MYLQRIQNFAKFLRFNYISGDFDEGQLLINGKYYSQLNCSSIDQKVKDLTHELAHFILAPKSDYRKLNFGLDLPGIGKTVQETELDSMACVLGCMIMNYFGCDSDFIYDELMNDNFEDQTVIDDAIDNLIEKKVLLWVINSKIHRSIKFSNVKYRTPKYFLIPKLFTLNSLILRRP